MISYFEQFEAFCYHNTQFCATCLHGKTLDVRIIVAPTVKHSGRSTLATLCENLELMAFMDSEISLPEKWPSKTTKGTTIGGSR